MYKKTIICADLDDTIIKTATGETFPKHCADVAFRVDTIEAIKAYEPKALFIISNQGGIEAGYFTQEDIRSKMRGIRAILHSVLPKVLIKTVWCATNDKNDVYRKPNPGMVNLAIDTASNNLHQHFTANDVLMIGDASGKPGNFSDSDKVCAMRAGVEYMDVEDFIETYRPKEA